MALNAKQLERITQRIPGVRPCRKHSAGDALSWELDAVKIKTDPGFHRSMDSLFKQTAQWSSAAPDAPYGKNSPGTRWAVVRRERWPHLNRPRTPFLTPPRFTTRFRKSAFGSLLMSKLALIRGLSPTAGLVGPRVLRGRCVRRSACAT